MDLSGYKEKEIIYQGATGFIQEGYKGDSPAVTKIIEVVHKNER